MRSISLGWIFVLIAPTVFAEEARNADGSDSPADEIQLAIADWESPSFSKRIDAMRKVRSAGVTAFPALAEVAKHGSGEGLSRALEILKSSLKSPDASTKLAARNSLNEIALASNSTAGRLAQQIVREHDRPPQLAQFRAGGPGQFFGPPNAGMPGMPGMQMMPGMQGMPGMAPPPALGTMRMGARNGTITLEATDNEGKVKIDVEANGNLKMEVTRKKLGIETTEKIEAANEAELKTKQPEAYRILKKYEPHLQVGRNIIAQQGQGNFRRANPPPIPADPRQRMTNSMTAASTRCSKTLHKLPRRLLRRV